MRDGGYLLVDNRVSGGPVHEAATSTCTHCQRIIILNPLRMRERHYCRKCDHLICDACALLMKIGHPCRPMKQILDELQERMVKHVEV
jgi:hypothetical protein